jgi:hypothetical protein
MGIPEAQLQTWSHQGAVTTAKATHESVRAALATAPQLAGEDFEVFLQGSYKNDTNIRGDADVDIVVQLNSTWQEDLTGLTAYEQLVHQAQGYAQVNGLGVWNDFRGKVLVALRNRYGAGSVTEGRNALTVSAGTGRLAADVVVALQYRKYTRFLGGSPSQWVEGISFWSRPDSRRVINFPKPHYDNAVAKNGWLRTNGWYKPSVRMFKNARNRLVDEGWLLSSITPSYFLECLLYNVPDDRWGRTFADTYYNVVDWLSGHDMG